MIECFNNTRSKWDLSVVVFLCTEILEYSNEENQWESMEEKLKLIGYD